MNSNPLSGLDGNERPERSKQPTLNDLVKLAQSDDPDVIRRAEDEIYSRTRRFVQFLIREAKGDQQRHVVTTEWLANAAEKSFLSYIKKKDWDDQVPVDKVLLAILRTITVRMDIARIEAARSITQGIKLRIRFGV